MLLDRPVMYNPYGNIDPKEVFEKHGGIDKFVRWKVKQMYVTLQRRPFY